MARSEPTDNAITRRQLLKGLGGLAAGAAALPVIGAPISAAAQQVAPTATPAAAIPTPAAPATATPAPAPAATAIPQPQVQPQASIPKRQDVLKQFTWDLEAIYSTDDLWEADFGAVTESLAQLESYEGTLGQSAGRLLEFMQLQDEAGILNDKLYVFASMRRDEDNGNSHYKGMADRAQSLNTQFGKATAFVSPELLALPEGTLESFLQSEPKLEQYRHLLDDLIRQRAHVRSAEVEAVLALASEMRRTAEDSFGALTDADMKFPSIKDEDGKTVEMSAGRYYQYLQSPDRRVRKEAFLSIHQTYQKYRNTTASMMSGQLRADLFGVKTRNYPSCLEAALESDNVPVEVYHNLIGTVEKNLPKFRRYIDLRRRVMKLPDLHFYDMYVPMVEGVDQEVSYEDATKKVVEALRPLGDEYVETLRKGIASRWIDVYENQGKNSGAYSWGAYSTAPYVLFNYQGTLDDVITLAHELGHSMHSYFTRKSQPYVYGNTPIFVAEVASTVNEALLNDYLVKNSSDKRVRAYLINRRLEDFRGTLVRQTMFAEFEMLTHAKAEAGEPTTADALVALYRGLLDKYFGDSVVMDEEMGIEWSRVPHFYSPFYVYKYATGISAASALSKQILVEGAPAVERYIEFLKSGSSSYPIDLLKAAGVDMASPAPIQEAMDTFDALITEFESLL